MILKITVQEVDLGASIEQIIADDIYEISALNKQQIADATAVAREAEVARTAKTRHKDAAEEVLEKIYAELKDATERNSGVTGTRLLTLAAPTISNMSGLILRLQHFLKAKGNPYRLLRKGKKCPTYHLVPFNLTDAEEDQ